EASPSVAFVSNARLPVGSNVGETLASLPSKLVGNTNVTVCVGVPSAGGGVVARALPRAEAAWALARFLIRCQAFLLFPLLDTLRLIFSALGLLGPPAMINTCDQSC
ncbi:unnamed protein product, partial [Meganyctiphanes norvegica]